MRRNLLYFMAVLLGTILCYGCGGSVPEPEFTKEPEKEPVGGGQTEPPSVTDTSVVHLSTAMDWANVVRRVNAGELKPDITIYLDKDLDFSSVTTLIGLGTKDRPFKGTLDGQGHAIRKYKGFSPLVPELGKEGKVQNLKVAEDCVFEDRSGKSGVTFAPFVGICRGTIRSCTNSAAIDVISPGADADITLAGIAAKVTGNDVLIEDCHNKNLIRYRCGTAGLLHKGLFLGCIVGTASEATLTIRSCSQSGDITSDTGGTKVNGALCSLGGIAAYLRDGIYILENCTSEGTRLYPQQFNNTTTLEGGVFAGGIAGVLDGKEGSSISSCTSAIHIGGKRGKVGGIAGYVSHTAVTSCSFTAGSIAASIATMTAGIAADLVSSSVSRCTVQADISTTSTSGDASTGGIAAQMDANSRISDCKYYGIIRATNGPVGGLVGTAADGSVLSGNGFGGEINGEPMLLSQGRGNMKGQESGSFLLSGSDFKGDITVSGHVYDQSGHPIPGVVVSDGYHCTATDAQGNFGLDTDLSTARFVFLSCPSGYSLEVKDGLPQFYKTLSDLGGKLTDIDFRLSERTDPSEPFTVFFAADPQPRASSAAYDKIAYHSLTVAEDFYADVAEKASEISGDKFAIVLGDLVHENMSLFSHYLTGIKTMGMPTWSVIGNHDHDPSAADDVSGARIYEQNLGPRCYSFNRGGIHFVTVDNMIMKQASNGRLTDYIDGLTDEDWNFLKEDLSYVDKSCPVIICAHSPLFRKSDGSDPSGQNSTPHGLDYAYLLSNYSHVYSFAGHTHTSFNYCYEDGIRQNFEQHTLVRCTGALWLNEYISTDGTPRGYVIMSVKGPEDISWKFEPVKIQTGETYSTPPSYAYRDWDYKAGRALLRGSGKPLDSNYQMHVFGKGLYGDIRVYANVFLYDEKWSLPELTVGGKTVRMEPVSDKSAQYDLAYKELFDFYSEQSATWRGATSEFNFMNSASSSHMFTCEVSETLFGEAAASAEKGTVSVRDRFGNTYTSEVTWSRP